MFHTGYTHENRATFYVAYSPVWHFGSWNSYPDSWHLWLKNQLKTNLKNVAQTNQLSAVYPAEIYKMGVNLNDIQMQEGWSVY